METSQTHPATPFNPWRLRIALAWADLTSGLDRWWLSATLAWQDIVQRYRGSVLGPLWLSLSMAIMIGTLGFLYSALFKIDLSIYFPYLSVGLVWWSMLSAMITDGCQVFISSEVVIKQIRLPHSIYIYRMIIRNLIIAAHNMVVYLVVAVVFGIWPGANLLFLVPGLFLVLLNAFSASLVLGMVCARFRDLPQIVASLVQMSFFLTPIIWQPETLNEREFIVHYNPFHALIDLLRAPLLGDAPHPLSWILVGVITVVNVSISFVFFSRFRSRIPYWC